MKMEETFLKHLSLPKSPVNELEPIDLEEINNPQYIGHYVNEIMDHLRETEVELILDHFVSKPL